ncbi:MAG: hypothetical protein K0S78_843 [Thermomicrobiales bacterium]|nr:hypothetical protein [Thermomicrobiales bacterium]
MGVNMKMIQQMQTRLEKMQRELAETRRCSGNWPKRSWKDRPAAVW